MSQSESTTGVAVSGGATFTALIARAQALLHDESGAEWDGAITAVFLNEAIRDYSGHFPRAREATLTLSAGAHTADLPADFLGLLAVAYPPGGSPPRYLARLGHQHAAFWRGTGWYDVEESGDAGGRARLWLSAAPAAGDTAVVRYHARHALIDDPAAPAGENSVPEAHQHLLLKYVLWAATNHLLLAEQREPAGGSSSLLMAQLSQNARRLENAYHTALRQAIYGADGRSRVLPWIEAGHSLERIY